MLINRVSICFGTNFTLCSIVLQNLQLYIDYSLPSMFKILWHVYFLHAGMYIDDRLACTVLSGWRKGVLEVRVFTQSIPLRKIKAIQIYLFPQHCSGQPGVGSVRIKGVCLSNVIWFVSTRISPFVGDLIFHSTQLFIFDRPACMIRIRWHVYFK